MAEVTKHTCDGPGCAEVRGESNHWLLAKVESRFDGPTETFTGIIVRRWDDKVAHKKGTLHLCGRSCATKIVSAAVEGWK